MNQFQASYNRIIYLTCGALVLLALIIESIQLYRDQSALLKDLQNRLDSYARGLNVRARTAEGYVSGLKTVAENDLFYIQQYETQSPLISFLREDPDGEFFSMDVQSIDKKMVGNLTGLGRLEDLPPEIHDEINMALMLDSYFEVGLQNNPGAVWVYYTSKNGFQNLYPWLPASQKQYYKSALEQPFFKGATPENNPHQQPFWTSIYEDGNTEGSVYHRGHVVTCSAPVYDGDEFLGAVSLDVSLNEFNRILQSLVIPSGQLLLVNQEGQVLGSSMGDLLQPDSLKAFLQEDQVYRKIVSLLKGAPGKFDYAGSQLLYVSNLASAPWSLVYVSQKQEVLGIIYWHAFEDILIIVLSLIFIVGVGYWVVVRDFISPSQKLVNHIEKENRGEASEPQHLPGGWQPWFEIVSKIFSENRSLMEDLEKRVKRRTLQLQKKNQQLETILRELKQAQDQIIVQEKLASLGSLTAGIAHEIKNPLNFITNFSEVSLEFLDELREDFPKDNETVRALQQNIEKVHEHALRADSIVKNMLAHAHGSEGVFEIVDINKLLSESIDLAYVGFRGNHPHFNVKIVKKLDTTLPPVYIVSQDVARVFLNIINNACFSMEEKQRTQGGDYKPTLEVSVGRRDEWVEIILKDNGLGMKKSVLSKIFNPFFTTKKPGEGTGLGMSLSYDIITKQNRGNIEVKSKFGEYASFIICLPLQ